MSRTLRWRSGNGCREQCDWGRQCRVRGGGDHRRYCVLVGGIIGRPELVRIGELQYRGGEPMHILSDATRLCHELGFEPRYDLDLGLHQTIEWWRKQVAVV